MKISLIVEGPGDERAVPCLVAKTADLIGDHIIISRVIKSKGIHRLSRAGEIERFVKLADGPDIESILIVVDLDDGCPVSTREELSERISAMGDVLNAEVRICFCIREYECWFLENMDHLTLDAPEYGWLPDFSCENPTAKRDAKGILNSAMTKHYKEIVDQLKLTQRLDLKALYAQSRSYRRFVKALAGCDYDLIEATIA
jgi:hypothetical protein